MQIQFSLIKKKIGRPEHSQTPYPLHLSDNISFLSYPFTPPTPLRPQGGRHMCITPNSFHYFFSEDAFVF